MSTDTYTAGDVVTFAHPLCFGTRRRVRTPGHNCPYRCKERRGQQATVQHVRYGVLRLRFSDGQEFAAEPSEVERAA